MAMKADLLYALRTLRKNPMFTVVALASLALGIGANTAIFSLMNHIMLRLISAERPEELVQLDHTGPNRGSTWNNRSFSYLQYLDLRNRTQTLSGLLGHFRTGFSFSESGQTDRVQGDIVSGNYFQVLGIQPAAGRLLTPDDDKTIGGHPVVVISYPFWMQRFGGKPDVVNRKILLNGQPMTIVGVTERGFNGVALDDYVDVMAPITMKRALTPTWYGLDDRRTTWLQLIGRRKPGVSLEQAQAELHSVFAPINQMELDNMFGNISESFRKRWLDKKLVLIDASHGPPDLQAQMSKPLYALMGMVGLVLLIACANLANLLMAKSAARRKEIAVRLALGASRYRLIRQLLVESALLGLLGGLAGLLVAMWTVDALSVVIGDADTVSRMPSLIDARVMIFNVALSIATGVLFGLIPALQSTRPSVSPALKDEAGNVSSSGEHVRFRKVLIAGQVTLSLLLLIAAGLFARSLYNLRSVNPGFRTESLVSFSVDAALNGYSNDRGIDFALRLQEQLQGVPGVKGVGLGVEPVLTNSINRSTVTVDGYQSKEGEDMNPQVEQVSPAFFSTLGIPLVAGRDLTARDRLGAPKVAVVNQSFVKYFFQDENPLGRRIRFGRCPKPEDCAANFMEIVGVVKDSMHGSLKEPPTRRVYPPIAQMENLGGLTGYVRAGLDPAAVSTLIRREVSRLDSNMPVAEIRTLDTVIDNSIRPERLVAMLSAAFGLLATVLAAVGLYGVMAYIVARRTREIGIRMALGALQGSVLWLVMKEVAWMTGIGLAIGLPLAFAAAQLIEKLLYGVQARDFLVFAAATAALALVAALAGLIPARRATSIDPIRALRYE